MNTNLTWARNTDPNQVVQCRWDVKDLCVRNYQVGDIARIKVDVETPVPQYDTSVFYAFDNFKFTVYPDEILFDTVNADDFRVISYTYKIPSSYFFDAYVNGDANYVSNPEEDSFLSLNGESSFILLNKFVTSLYFLITTTETLIVIY